MNFGSLNQDIAKLNTFFDNSTMLSTDDLVGRMESFSSSYPEDKTAGSLLMVLTKVASRNPVISKGEFRNLYTKSYTNGTNVISAFPELKEAELLMSKKVKSSFNYLKPKKDDSLLGTSLKNMFEGKDTHFSSRAENSALNEVKELLNFYGVGAKRLTAAAGNSKSIIVLAEYETPKGMTGVLIPVGICNDKASLPQVFVGKVSNQINKNNIVEYLQANAGESAGVGAENLLNFMTKEATNSVSDIDLAVIKIASKKPDNISLATNQILGVEVFKPSKPAFVSPHHSNPGRFGDFEKQMTSAPGEAKFRFGEAKVRLACEMLQNKLAECLVEPQIKLTKVADKELHFAVSTNVGVSFVVPVKMGENIKSPEYFISNGSICPLTKEVIQKMASEGLSDNKIAAQVSAQGELRTEELIDIVRVAMAEGNSAKAEDALNILQTRGMDAYMIGFEAYKNALVRTASTEEKKCSMPLKTAHSKHVLCGHTNLPLHKVFVDKFGHCLPLHRKNSVEASKPALTMTQRIFG